MKRVSISDRTARVALRVLEDYQGFVNTDAAEELRRALAPKPKKVFVSAPTRKQTKAAKRRTKKEETAEIRAAVVERARGFCECGCETRLEHFFDAGAQMDHFWGRGKTRQSVENCWLLSASHHRSKTDNTPSRLLWVKSFAAHAGKHGYAAELKRAGREIYALQAKAEFAKGAAAHG